SSRETFVSYKIQHTKNGQNVLHPVLSWKTRIGQMKNISHGDYIGYGCSYKVTRDSIIAVLPVGYSDGVDRKLSNNGYFLINGNRAPIRGRICMNLTMIDVTDIPGLKVEDEVVLIGRSGNDYISVEDWAGWIGTINYEMVTKINPKFPRIIK
ncbi:MAG: alanine racemase, partial [Calditrichia bacterium]|nr:alanine racemase [Calditrichia bacterium]